MRAAVIHAARDLRLDERAEPSPMPGEVVVRFGAGGICGSDLSYWSKGRVGDFALQEPLVLGHEISGEIEALGEGVSGLAVGQRVAVNPSRPCLHCDYCRAGRSNLCRNMRFFGSAAIVPHVQGGFSERFVCRADQAVPVPADMPFEKAALAEPLSVAIHGIRRAGELLGKRVLIAGAGPIGLLLALAARRVGAGTVTITDLVDEPLALARRAGVDEGINVAAHPERLAAYEANKGTFDVALEATGSPAALASLFRVVRPGGRVVQLGMMPPGDSPVPVNMLMAREIDFVGAFRFSGEFETAVDWLVRDRIDVAPVMSALMPMARLDEAFALAADRRRAIKVHLHF
ncbi:L-idonate 5-dehydrogenase [Aurantimonas sp. Leaf443]|uniref:L-idonate 5-dehydrogenase n=1 Tax=Aurantimonas sp. Leaf443 TaxID=1736378 RepID=UPI0007006183|nr:L-idonate 5-dehydrogenase [Aurantimonas sp. Leaf443]KQT84041.1 L-idonate 5-dehydrogenase [Aurantimonas sp. Leaf443]